MTKQCYKVLKFPSHLLMLEVVILFIQKPLICFSKSNDVLAARDAECFLMKWFQALVGIRLNLRSVFKMLIPIGRCQKHLKYSLSP